MPQMTCHVTSRAVSRRKIGDVNTRIPVRGSTMTATNHDDQLCEIYPTMLNELNCTFGVSFSRLHVLID